MMTSARGCTLWLTGLSGAGKSTITAHLVPMLNMHGCKVEVLDGDQIRANLSTGLGFSRQDRDTNIRRIGFVCHLLTRNGVFAIAAAISPYQAVRNENRALIKDFVEVYVKASLETCIQRDVKGLYQQALAGKIKEFTGVSDPYEPPDHPEVTCDTEQETPAESAQKIIHKLVELGYLMPVMPVRRDGDGAHDNQEQESMQPMTYCFCILGWHFHEGFYRAVYQIPGAKYIICHRERDYVAQSPLFDRVRRDLYFCENRGLDWGGYHQFNAMGFYRAYDFVIYCHDDLIIKDTSFITALVARFRDPAIKIIGNGGACSEFRFSKYRDGMSFQDRDDFLVRTVRGSFFAAKTEVFSIIGNFPVYWNTATKMAYGNISVRDFAYLVTKHLGIESITYLDETRRLETRYLIELRRGRVSPGMDTDREAISDRIRRFQVGQWVKIKGRLENGRDFYAVRIRLSLDGYSSDKLESAVEWVNHEQETFGLMGLEVHVAPEKGGKSPRQGPSTLPGLKPGTLVKVSGRVDPPRFVAKRVTETSALLHDEIQGQIVAIDAAKATIEVAGFVVRADAETKCRV